MMNKDNLWCQTNKNISSGKQDRQYNKKELKTTNFVFGNLPHLIIDRIPGDGERIVDVVKCPNQILWLL